MRSWPFVSTALAGMLFSSVAAASSGLDPTHISLPSGPGSIEGLGKNFAPSLASGTASYGVDIAVPPAAGGFEPRLSLDYDSSGGVTEVGMGWRLGGLPSIRRRTENGLPRFLDTDPLEISAMGVACDLVEVSAGTFRPQYESGAFVRVQRAGSDTWEARDKSGTLWKFGGAGFEEAEGPNVATYLLSEAVDLHGHRIDYAWDTSSGHGLLQHVVWNDYGDSARNEILLAYEDRPDVHVLFGTGVKEVLSKRLTSIEVRHGGSLVRRYELAYAKDDHSRLAAVTLVGRDGTSRLPTLSLGYTPQTFQPQIIAMQNPPGRTPGDPNVELADLDGDGLPDLLVTGQASGQYRSYLNKDGVSWQSGIDWDLAQSPSMSLATVGVQLADFDGDGAIDLVAKSGTNDFRYFPGNTATSFRAPVQIATVPNFTFEDPDARLADMDGDRRIDVVITTEAGLTIGYNLSGVDWTVPRVVGQVDSRQALRFSDGGHTQLCDVNGDRVQDLCYLTSGSLVYWLGRGRGIFEPAQTATGVPSFDPSSPWELHDLNGDGWVDLVHVGADKVDVALAIGAGQFGVPRAVGSVPMRGPNTAVRFADMNASGTVDIVWIDVSGDPSKAWQYLELFPAGRAGLLSRIDNGLGKVSSVQYGTAAQDAAAARMSSSPWTTRINVAMPVVREVDVDDALGDPLLRTQYAYANGTFSPIERTFAGFGGGTETDMGDAYTPTLITTTTFDVGLVDRQLRGMVLANQTSDPTGVIFARTTDTWTTRSIEAGIDGRSVEYSFKSSEQVDSIEGTDATKARTTLTEWDQDSFGNPVRESKWGEIALGNKLAGNDEAITTRTFANNVQDWILGRLATEELQDASGARVGMKRVYYDGAPFVGLPSGQVARGDVTRSEQWVGPDLGAFELENTTSYDPDGNPLETRNARGGGSLFSWDPSDRTTLLSESRKLERGSLTETATTDRAFGTLLSVTGYNGQTTSVQYDPFGRVASVIRPGESPDRPTIRYTYAPSAPLSRVTTERRTWSGGDAVETSEQLVDGLGRHRGAFTTANSKWILDGVKLLDARGNARRILRPRFASDSEHLVPPIQQDGAGDGTWRDAVGRTIRTRSQLGIETRHAYAPFLDRHWDGAQTDPSSPYEHTPITDAHDGLGRVVSHMSVLAGAAVASTFEYDPAGDLLSKLDPEGNLATYGYDGRGRRVLVVDPDAGRHSFVYDASGNVIEHHKPDGNVVRFTYDLADREVTQDWDGDGRPEVTNSWDGSPLTSGLLSSVVAPSGVTSFGYDERQRQTTTSYVIGGQTYEVSSSYDAQDREYLHGFPDRSSVRIQRDSRGAIVGYGNAVSIAYNADGLETSRTFNTGVAQLTAYDDDRRPIEKRATGSNGAVLLDLKWTYDAARNILAVSDLRPGASPRDRSEQYAYDNLYRLRTATGKWGQAQWSYSASGNLLTRTSSVGAVDAGALTYGASAGPHALTGILSRTIRYDAVGRMLADGQRQYAWDGADHLVSVRQADGASVDNVFDGNGTRRVRRERAVSGATSETIFLDAWSEVKDGKLVRYLVHAGRRFARLSDGTGATAASPKEGGCEVGAEPPGALGALLILVACLVAWRRVRLPASVLLAGLVIALTGGGCSGVPGGVDPGQNGTVQGLSDADSLLFDDAVGSLAEETSGSGIPRGSFAAYPYGLSRWDESNEGRKFANAPRDMSIGLDQMEARAYAPDLGVWTSVDPLRVDKPERGVTSSVAADQSYAYAGLSPIVAVDPDGRDPLPNWLAGGIGFAVGFVQGVTPGGFLTSAMPVPSAVQKSFAYQYWNGAGQVAGGLAATTAATGEEGVGAALDATGVGALVGVPINVAATAQAASGITSIVAGMGKMASAHMMSGTPGGAGQSRLGFGDNDLVLGLNKGGSLKQWAAQNGGKTFGEFDTPAKNFDGQIRSAMGQADRIRVNLDGVDPSRASGALNEHGEPASGYTNYELDLLKTTPEFADKAVFYEKGGEVPSPFAKGTE